MLLYNNILALELRAMFGSAFELRVNFWVEVGLLTFPLVFSSSPCLAVFILEVRVSLHKYPYFHRSDDLQSSLRIQGLMTCPNSSMDMAKLLIVVS
jgi:hypothetical protein